MRRTCWWSPIGSPEHLDDDGIRIVEVDEDPALYAEAHIPGAIGFDWQKDCRTRSSATSSGPRISASCGRERHLERPPSCSTATNNWFAAYAYWYLKYYGHDNVKLINGPRESWIGEGRPTTTEVPSFRPRVHGAGRRRRDPRHARRVLGRSTTGQLVDVRSPQEFSGELIAMAGYEQEGAQRGGHIPGAACPWAQAVREDGTFKSADELRELYGGKGIRRRPDHRLLPHRRALGAHLVRAARSARPRRRAQLRRLVDRVGQPRRRADREGRLSGAQPGGSSAPISLRKSPASISPAASTSRPTIGCTTTVVTAPASFGRLRPNHCAT